MSEYEDWEPYIGRYVKKGEDITYKIVGVEYCNYLREWFFRLERLMPNSYTTWAPDMDATANVYSVLDNDELFGYHILTYKEAIIEVL
jgi:hypothetical protein